MAVTVAAVQAHTSGCVPPLTTRRRTEVAPRSSRSAFHRLHRFMDTATSQMRAGVAESSPRWPNDGSEVKQDFAMMSRSRGWSEGFTNWSCMAQGGGALWYCTWQRKGARMVVRVRMQLPTRPLWQRDSRRPAGVIRGNQHLQTRRIR